MERIAIKSSHVVSIGYDEDTKTLEAEFAPKREGEAGKVYQFRPIARRDFEALLNGESAGRFINRLKYDTGVTRTRVEAEA